MNETGAGSTPENGNAAVYYMPDGYDTSRGKLMGRHAAGEGFLQGFARYAQAERLIGFAETAEHFDIFRKQLAEIAPAKTVEWVPFAHPERLQGPGCLYLPGPALAEQAWIRCGQDATAYSLTGVTHTICTHRVMDQIGAYLVEPVQEWDALICTSDAVKRGVENVLAGYGEYLCQRLEGARLPPGPQLPVIPLGVDCDRFAEGDAAVRIRTRLRKQYRIGADEICVLFFGRLAYHAKAHPMPMYQALESASRASGRKIHLIQAGWFATDGIKRAFVQGARALCPSVDVIYVDGRAPDIRKEIWHAADIFCSFSDNVQETYGLTPLEAMAAGLPVVVSDWDGYRQTVEHDVCGFLVPTTMPAAGSGAELARRHAVELDNYDHHIGYVSQSISVSQSDATVAFLALINNEALRRKFGDAGRLRARQQFDWREIVARYQELWGELAARRLAARKGGRIPPGTVPLRPDPFAVFSHYATSTLAPDSVLTLAVEDGRKAFRRLSGLKFNQLGRELLSDDADVNAMLDSISGAEAMTLAELLRNVAPEQHSRRQRTLVWLAKMGIINIAG